MRARYSGGHHQPPLQKVCNFPNYKGVHPQESPDGLWGSVRGSNFNILLIDDSEAEAKVFQSALTKVAPRTTLYWVASAKEGLEYLRQEGRFQGVGSVSIVVCDLNMPVMSGFDFAEQMKKDPALIQIPLIVYSGSQAPQDISRAYSLGVNSYLVKPMTIDTMVQQVEVLVKYWLDTNKLVNGWHFD